MDPKNVIAKLQEILTKEDLVILESAIKTLVDEKTKLFESELKEKYDIIAEDFVNQELATRLVEEVAKITEEYDGKLQLAEEKVVQKLNGFLEHVISEKISDETFQRMAINETALPIVENIKKVLEDSFISIDTNGSAKISALSVKNAELETRLNESVTEAIQLKEGLERSAKYILISEQTEGLLPSQKAKVKEMFLNESFNSVQKKIGSYVSTLKESAKPRVTVQKKKLSEVVDRTEDIKILEESKKINPNIIAKDHFTESVNKYLN